MYCSRCGEKISENGRFCTKCGALLEISAPMSIKSTSGKKNKKWVPLLCGILIGGFLGSVIGTTLKSGEVETAETVQRIEGEGFDTPEEAVIAYLEALKEGNIEKMVSTFAVETYVDNLDFKKEIEASGVYSYHIGIDSIDAYTRSINIVRRQNHIVNTVYLQYLGKNFSEEWLQPVSFGAEKRYESADALLEGLMNPNWMNVLSDIEYGRILRAYELQTLSDFLKNEDALEKEISLRCDRLNCEEYIPLAVETEFDGNSCYFTMDVIRYGDRWYNYNQMGIIGTVLGGDSDSGGFVEQ